MQGLIQKITLTNYQEYFFNTNILLELLTMEESSDELIGELSSFINKRKSTFDLINNEYGVDNRITGKVYLDGDVSQVYYHFNLSQDQINFLVSSKEFTELQTSRDIIFPKLGWSTEGYRVIEDPLLSEVNLNVNNTINFNELEMSVVDSVWSSSTPLT